MTTHLIPATPDELVLAEQGELNQVSVKVLHRDVYETEYLQATHWEIEEQENEPARLDAKEVEENYSEILKLSPIKPADEIVLAEEWIKDPKSNKTILANCGWVDPDMYEIKHASSMPLDLARFRFMVKEVAVGLVEDEELYHLWWCGECEKYVEYSGHRQHEEMLCEEDPDYSLPKSWQFKYTW